MILTLKVLPLIHARGQFMARQMEPLAKPSHAAVSAGGGVGTGRKEMGSISRARADTSYAAQQLSERRPEG